MKQEQPVFHEWFHKFLINFAMWVFPLLGIIEGITYIIFADENGVGIKVVIFILSALLILASLFCIKVRYDPAGFRRIAVKELLIVCLAAGAAIFLINWLMAALFGMIAFSAVNIDALIQVKKHLLRLLSGSIIPIWFFPPGVARVLGALPFVYIYQLPLSIYIGRGDRAQQLSQMRIQLIWLAVLAGLFFLVQNRVTRKVMVQGG